MEGSSIYGLMKGWWLIHGCAGNGDIVEEHVAFGGNNNSVRVSSSYDILKVKHVKSEHIAVEGEILKGFVREGIEIKVFSKIHININLLVERTWEVHVYC